MSLWFNFTHAARRLSALLVILAGAAVVRASQDPAAEFAHPPAQARPWVYWYWLQGAVSREGIDADLAAMQHAGVAGAYLMPVEAPSNPPIYTPLALPLTPRWWSLIHHAAERADQLGLKLAFDVGDGFATAGGPWITPALSMQKVVWSETTVPGGRPMRAPLVRPEAVDGYYRDIAVLAFPSPTGEGVSTRTVPVSVSTSTPGPAPQFLASGGDGHSQFQSKASCWIQYDFAHPFTARSLAIREWNHNYAGLYQATRLRIDVSDDCVHFHTAFQLTPPRHGWEDWGADDTFSLPSLTARCFRFVYDPAGSEPGAEDLDGAKWKPRLVLRGLVLSSAPRITGYAGKSGAVWRISPRMTATDLPDSLCVPRASILNLTSRLRPDGTLDWTPPAGHAWTILRLGHTSTGHTNETATSAKGLECDKFNAAAVTLQFNHWFGAILSHLGPVLSRRVVKIFHVDSWEAGSQNWTPGFRAEFERRRGYDPTPFLPTFAGIPVGSAAQSERFLADVRLTLADLLTERFFGTLSRLAHANGCVFSAEATAPTMTGDALRVFSHVDLPMGEFWLRSASHDKPTDVSDAVSGAHIYGRRIAQSEAFTELRIKWDETPALLKPLLDHEFCVGVNRLVLHVFVHNPWLDRKPGLTLNGVGTFFQRDQTWWPEARAWTDYIARCSALLQLGRPVDDVAYFTGEELPSRSLLPDRRVPRLPPGYSADSINPDALIRLAHLEDNRIVLPDGARYHALVLPPGQPPPSPELARALARLAPLVVEPGKSLAPLLPPPDFIATDDAGKPAEGVEWTHRTLPDADLYFVSNSENLSRTLHLSLRCIGSAEIWDPATGARYAAPDARTSAGRTSLTLPLAAHGALFAVVLRGTHPSPAPLPDLRPVATLFGPWSVQFDPTLGGPASAVTFPALADWTTAADPRVRYFSGTATYHTTFQRPTGERRIWLDLGTIHDIARVAVNGVDCGCAWTAPYRVDITRALHSGTNSLDIQVTNTWNNRIAGDRLAGGSARPVTWTNAPESRSPSLIPAGLIGPVRLLSSP